MRLGADRGGVVELAVAAAAAAGMAVCRDVPCDIPAIWEQDSM